MKIELYSVPDDIHGKAIKKFLEFNNIGFREIITDDINVLQRVAQMKLIEKISLLKVTYTEIRCKPLPKGSGQLQSNCQEFLSPKVPNKPTPSEILNFWDFNFCKIEVLGVGKTQGLFDSHSIHVNIGFNELSLNQLLEHIKKYNPKISVENVK